MYFAFTASDSCMDRLPVKGTNVMLATCAWALKENLQDTFRRGQVQIVIIQGMFKSFEMGF